MILFFRSFFFLIVISFLIGAEARALLGNDDGMMIKLKKAEIGNYGRTPYITPSPPESSTPRHQEIVGRHDHSSLPPPSPKHDPIIGQLTISNDRPDDHEAAVVILLPITVGGRHDHVPAPPAPKPEEGSGNHIDFPLQASY